jgi:peptidoglycan/LPS O-acetylase OafA/YrhL
MFFTLSGYLMGKGFFSGRYHLDSSRIASFYRNRALRIVPLYCVAVLLVAALETPEIFHPNRLWNLADILSFGSNGDPIHPIGALWSVSTEVQFYLLVPLLVLLFFARPLRRLHLVIPLLAAIALLGMIARRLVLQSFGAQVWGSLIYSPVLGNLDIFAFGMILNPVCECFRGRISLSGVGKLVLFSMVGLAGYFLMINFTLRAMVRPEPADFFGMIGCGPTIAAAFTGGLIFIAEATVVDGGESRLLKIITAGGCQAGLLSYSIYVWHEPIIVGIRRWFPTTLSEYRSFVALIICLPVIGVAAAASYYLIERPFERLKWRARS